MSIVESVKKLLGAHSYVAVEFYDGHVSGLLLAESRVIGVLAMLAWDDRQDGRFFAVATVPDEDLDLPPDSNNETIARAFEAALSVAEMKWLARVSPSIGPTIRQVSEPCNAWLEDAREDLPSRVEHWDRWWTLWEGLPG